MNRILTFHYHDIAGNAARMLPAYYMDADYEPVAVRIHAESAPLVDAKFDIFCDGVSIFTNKAATIIDKTSGVRTVNTPDTTVVLTAGENSEELAERFTETPIEKGTWLYCNMVDAGGGKNFTVQLELRQVSEDESQED